MFKDPRKTFNNRLVKYFIVWLLFIKNNSASFVSALNWYSQMRYRQCLGDYIVFVVLYRNKLGRGPSLLEIRFSPGSPGFDSRGSQEFSLDGAEIY